MYSYTCLEANLADVVHSWVTMSLNHPEYMGAYTTVPCHMPKYKRDIDSGLTFDMPTFAESSRAPPFGDGRTRYTLHEPEQQSDIARAASVYLCM